MTHTPLNNELREEARSYGLDPIKYKTEADLENDVVSQREMRQAVHAPQQPDVDSGIAEAVTPPGAVGEQVKIQKKNVIQPAPKTKARPRQRR